MELVKLRNRTLKDMTFGEQEKAKAEANLIKSGNYTYDWNGKIMSTRPINVENFSNFVNTKYKMNPKAPKRRYDEVVLSPTQKVNRNEKAKIQTIID